MKKRRSEVVKATANIRVKGKPWPTETFTGEFKDRRLGVPTGTVTFDRAHVTDVDMSGETFDNFVAKASVFERCDFTRCVWGGGALSDLPVAKYIDCDFAGADLRGVGPRFARFEHCRFVQARIDDWDALCAEFVGCTFGGRIVRAKFSGQPWGFAKQAIMPTRRQNDFYDNDFSGADLIDCSIFGGIDLKRNAWPPANDYVVIEDAQPKIARAKKSLDRLSPQAANHANTVLEIYSRGGFAKQKDLLVRRDELGEAASLLLD